MVKLRFWLLGWLLAVGFNAFGQCTVSLGPDTAACASGILLQPALAVAWFEDSLEITYDATQGVSGLAGAGKVYLHSGAEMVPFGGWQHVVGNWGQDDGVGEMQPLGNDRWRIRVLPHAYYGYSSTATPNGIFMVFRNADGSSTGKDDNGDDIWLDMGQDPPASAFGGVQAAWKRDAIDSIVWSDGSTGPSLGVSSSGSYWVQVTDTGGCIARDTVVVGLGSLPVVAIGDAAICDGQPAVLDAGAGFASYAWSTGATTQSITVSTAGTYLVTVTNAAGCEGVDVIAVPATSAPTALFTPNVSFFSVQFVDGSSYGVDYAWDFDGDGDTDATTPGTTSHTYSAAGSYSVRLIVRNACGADTAVQVVTIGAIGMEEGEGVGELTLFPNPAASHITLALRAPRPVELQAMVVDLQGRVLARESMGRVVGEFAKELDIQGLPAGAYRLVLVAPSSVQALPFIKMH